LLIYGVQIDNQRYATPTHLCCL